MLRFFASFLFAVLALPIAAAAQGVAYAPPTARAVVGEVTFAVGPTVRIGADGVPQSVQRGTQVLTGDRLDTADGGLLHVRFVDGALVSLRPGSRLWVEEYRYNPAQVSQSSVRFRLENGVARAISGAAAEGAKERFRLNTPLVAIGVRGTDFVVRSSAESTRASVNQGSIVVAPFGAGCLAQALGPCNSPTAQVLSADMGQVLVEFRPQFNAPELRPQQAQALASSRPASESSARAELTVAASAPSSTPGASEEAVTAALVRGIVTTHKSEPVAPPPVTGGVTGAVAPPDVVQPPQLPPVVVDTGPPALLWGRWNDATFAGDLSLPRSAARTGRVATVGDDHYLLYRIENGSSTLMPGLGAYDFTLQQAQAQYNAPGAPAAAASVLGGKLNIDFGKGSFATTLGLSSAATGAVTLQSSGMVRSDGVFIDRAAGHALGGATSLDGKSAGYLFERAAGSGNISGITLWSRP